MPPRRPKSLPVPPVASAPAAAAPAPAPVLTAQSLLIDWANEQDHWVRGLVSEVIETRQELPDVRIQHFYEMMLYEKELATGAKPNVPPLSGGLAKNGVGDTFLLKTVEATEHINALTPSQRLDFNPKMTVVFGENASGKTGYVRILKRAAGARTAENVLPNVMTPPGTTHVPRARMSYQLGTAQTTIDWANDAAVHPFTRMDVFDSRCIQLHLEEDLTYIYTPGELSLFPFVQHGIENVRLKLEGEVKRRTTTVNPYLRDFERGSRVYTKIESLGAATDLGELRQLSVVSEADQAHVTSLKQEIEALRSQSPETQARMAQAEQQFLESSLRALKVVAQFDPGHYDEARKRLAQAREAYEVATKSAFAGLAIPGILEPEWRAFIESGEKLLTATDREKYPSDNDQCLYCQQALDQAAATLVRKYRDYCNSTLQAAVAAAERELNGIKAPILRLEVGPTQQALNGRLADAQETATTGLWRELAETLSAITALRESVARDEDMPYVPLPADAVRVSGKVEVRRQELGQLVADLKDRSEARQTALREREAVHLDIASRQQLATRFPEIERYVREAQWVSKAEINSRRFQPIFRSLTEASKAASEKLLNQDFEKRFRAESKKLRAPQVKLFFPGRQGQVARRKSVVADHRLSEILSEGEQKVIALADFLAEVGLKPKAPVVFDDPVNSLDYRRMAEFVDRLVALSDERQVVVFTHNIWFTVDLLSRFEKRSVDCAYYDVQSDGVHHGVISKGSHPRDDKFSTLRGRLNTLLQSAEKATGETQQALIEKGYEYLRGLCEVAVETDLLQGVTQRYQPNVSMTRLSNIKFDRLQEASTEILRVFEKACRYIASHSQPLETLNIRPTLADLQKDWKSVEEARAKYIA